MSATRPAPSSALQGVLTTLQAMPRPVAGLLMSHLRSPRAVVADALAAKLRDNARVREEEDFRLAIGVRDGASGRAAQARRLLAAADASGAFQNTEAYRSLVSEADRAEAALADAEDHFRTLESGKREAAARREHLHADTERPTAADLGGRLRKLRVLRAVVVGGELVMVLGYAMGVAGVVGLPSWRLVSGPTWIYIGGIAFGNAVVVFVVPWLIDQLVHRMGLARRLLPVALLASMVLAVVAFGLVVLNRASGMTAVTLSPGLSEAASMSTPMLLFVATLVSGTFATLLHRRVQALEDTFEVANREEGHLDGHVADVDAELREAKRAVEAHRRAIEAPRRAVAEVEDDVEVLRGLRAAAADRTVVEQAEGMAVWDRVTGLPAPDQEEIERRFAQGPTASSGGWLGVVTRLGRASAVLFALHLVTGCAPEASHVEVVCAFDSNENSSVGCGTGFLAYAPMVWAEQAVAAYVPGSSVDWILSRGGAPTVAATIVVPDEGWTTRDRTVPMAAVDHAFHAALAAPAATGSRGASCACDVDVLGAVELARRAALMHPDERTDLVIASGGWNLAPGVDLSVETPALNQVLGRALVRGAEWDLSAFSSVTVCGLGLPSRVPSRIPERDRFLVDFFAKGGGPTARFLDDCHTFMVGGTEVLGEAK